MNDCISYSNVYSIYLAYVSLLFIIIEKVFLNQMIIHKKLSMHRIFVWQSAHCRNRHISFLRFFVVPSCWNPFSTFRYCLKVGLYSPHTFFFRLISPTTTASSKYKIVTSPPGCFVEAVGYLLPNFIFCLTKIAPNFFFRTAIFRVEFLSFPLIESKAISMPLKFRIFCLGHRRLFFLTFFFYSRIVSFHWQ